MGIPRDFVVGQRAIQDKLALAIFEAGLDHITYGRYVKRLKTFTIY